MENFRSFDFWKSTIDFIKTWLIPKVAVALPVWVLTSMIFSLPLETEVSEEFTANFERVFQIATNIYFFIFLIFMLVLFSSCFLVSNESWFSKGIQQKAAHFGRILGSILLFGYGLFWFPLVFSTVFVHALNIRVGTFNESSALIFLGIYLFLGFIFFLASASFPTQRPRRYITYKLQSKTKLKAADIKKIEGRANSIIGGSRGIVFLSVTQCDSGKAIYLLAGQAPTPDYRRQSRFIDSMFNALRIEWGPQLTWKKLEYKCIGFSIYSR